MPPTITSAGQKLTPRGPAQTNVLLDPNTGLPISVIEETDGSRRLAVDANLSVDQIVVDTRDLTIQTDAVAIGTKATGNLLYINPDGSINADVILNAASDNVAIADATSGNKLTVNADGSINVTTASSSATTPTIFNVNVPFANTEVSQLLPANTKKIQVKVRNGSSRLQLAFTSGQSGTNYISLTRGTAYEESSINAPSLTLYFQTNTANQVIEILTWN